MFRLENLFKKQISKDEIATLLKTNKEALNDFEQSYKKQVLVTVSDNLFEVSSKQASELRETNNIDGKNVDCILVNRIVDELIDQTEIWSYDRNKAEKSIPLKTSSLPLLTNEDICKYPKELQPQLTGTLMMVDISQPSYISLLDTYKRYLSSTNKKAKEQYYHRFRQGLDILDLDDITYQMIGMNPNSIGYWLPQLIKPVEEEGFFNIPKTTIIKVPITLLQLTRKEYDSLNNTTIKIVDEYCKKVFDLDVNKDYFVKTGTYSSKFDFRNAHVIGKKEVNELGQYLLYIHYQALCMAHYDLSGRKQSSIYGVSTTNEWCVREFIKDTENRPTIYNGLPLRTEYRAFVDFDSGEVLSIHPYWDSTVMKKRFGAASDSDTPKMMHDYITFSACEDILNKEYNKNKDLVVEHIKKIIPNVELHGQWSIDIMQNGEDFWIIDLALAENSAYYETVPVELRRPSREEWLPVFKGTNFLES